MGYGDVDGGRAGRENCAFNREKKKQKGVYYARGGFIVSPCFVEWRGQTLTREERRKGIRIWVKGRRRFCGGAGGIVSSSLGNWGRGENAVEKPDAKKKKKRRGTT